METSAPSRFSKRHVPTERYNSPEINSKANSITDFSVNNRPLSFCSLYRQHDTTDFFYRPQSKSKAVTDTHGTVALHERRRRTNLRNAELSKRTFRIFLERQILSHMEIEIQKNAHEAQSPLTPSPRDNESNFSHWGHIRLALHPSQTIASENGSAALKNDFSLPDLRTEVLPNNNRSRSLLNYAVVHYDTDSETNVCANLFRSGSKTTTYAISVSNENASYSKLFNKESNRTSMYDNGPEWFQDNETVSVHGSLLSETISDASTYSNLDLRNINRRRCGWRRILFCCVN